MGVNLDLMKEIQVEVGNKEKSYKGKATKHFNKRV